VAEYTFRLAGGVAHFKKVECATLDEARNEAVRFLGSYLSEHPGFADEGHWRVNVEDAFGLPLLHVIVATVTSREIRSRNAA
jgi:hypothetical protein